MHRSKDEIREALLAMPDVDGSKATINGVKVERTGVEGWLIRVDSWWGLLGGVEWAAGKIAQMSPRDVVCCDGVAYCREHNPGGKAHMSWNDERWEMARKLAMDPGGNVKWLTLERPEPRCDPYPFLALPTGWPGFDLRRGPTLMGSWEAFADRVVDRWARMTPEQQKAAAGIVFVPRDDGFVAGGTCWPSGIRGQRFG